MSQAALADRSGIPRDIIANIETGRRPLSEDVRHPLWRALAAFEAQRLKEPGRLMTMCELMSPESRMANELMEAVEAEHPNFLAEVRAGVEAGRKIAKLEAQVAELRTKLAQLEAGLGELHKASGKLHETSLSLEADRGREIMAENGLSGESVGESK